MSLLAPSILAADFSNLTQQIRAVELGNADIIHCDIMDGKFVPNITFGPKIVSTVKKITKLPIDVHLMIENAESIIPEFISAGATYITVHQESILHLDKVINSLKEKGIKAGVSINPSTPVETLKHVFHLVDLILVMSVNPGFGGQTFIEFTLNKVKELKKIREKNKFLYQIEIDGGINTRNILKVKNAGCDIIVAGTAVFNSKDIMKETIKLKKIIL